MRLTTLMVRTAAPNAHQGRVIPEYRPAVRTIQRRKPHHS